MPNRPTLEEDLRAIETINQRDVQFALANDPARMMSQWTDDMVLLQPGVPIQWGTYRYSLRPRGGGEAAGTGGKIMRVLQRQADGSWKIHRGMTIVDPQGPSEFAERLRPGGSRRPRHAAVGLVRRVVGIECLAAAYVAVGLMTGGARVGQVPGQL